jgi:cellulose synthase/poly-beta-1,6-N-acetylglucosamine synthase-like glycosyltransferase
VAATLLHDFSQAVFWVCLALLAFTFAGYPLWIALLARGKHARAARTASEHRPTITALVIAHNESERITARIENLLASDYPAEKLKVLIVSDGSTDDTAAVVENLRNPRVRIVALPERGGKPGGLNAGVAACDTDLIVFADARQSFAPDAISRLAAWFDDPKFGAVSGELEIAAAQSATGTGVGAYWKLERFLRRQEALLDSCIGCTGAIYAIRRSLYTPLPAETILDDVVIPMRIAIGGHRVGHDGEARAFDPQPQEPGIESRRKTRTLAGNFQMLFRHPGWLFPWGNRLWFRLIAHKYLRLIAPLLLALLLAASAVLWRHPLYLTALLLQIGFYLLALIGMATHLRNKVFAVPAGFVFLNAAVVRAFFSYLSGGDLIRWNAARPRS